MLPKCTSNKQIPLHLFLKDVRRREIWLRSIQSKTMGKHTYTSLRTIFKQMLSIQILQSVIHKIPLIPGLNPFILRHLKNVSQKMSVKEKVCILMWDERYLSNLNLLMIAERISYVVLRIGAITEHKKSLIIV